MIAFRDFLSKQSGMGAFLGGTPDSKRKAEEQALADMNDWIDGESIDVVSVETPGVLDFSSLNHSFRVWYRTKSSQPGPSPEV